MDHHKFLQLAYREALQGYNDGGVPVGSVLIRDDQVVSVGHNKRVQEDNPIIHGEMDAIRKAGRQRTYRDTVLYTTLSPCMMCAGTIVQFGIPEVVIGENINFEGNIPFLEEHGVKVHLMADQACIDLMTKFINEKPELWFEDIAEE